MPNTLKGKQVFVYPPSLDPWVLSYDVPYPVEGDVVYSPDFYFWDMSLKLWREIAEVENEQQPIGWKLRDHLVYHFVQSPNERFGQMCGEYVRVLHDPPYDRKFFVSEMRRANPGITSDKLLLLDKSIEPVFRDMPDFVPTMEDRCLPEARRIRLKGQTIIDASKEILSTRVGVDALEVALNVEPLKTIMSVMDREYGRTVQKIEVKQSSLMIEVNASEATLLSIKERLMRLLTSEGACAEKIADVVV